MSNEAQALKDRADEAAGFKLNEVAESLIDHAKRAASKGLDLMVDPNEILVAFGLDPIEGKDEEEEPDEGASDEGGEGDKEDEAGEGDERTREPERPGEGPTSQPGPAGEPTGPSETPSHPSPSAP